MTAGAQRWLLLGTRLAVPLVAILVLVQVVDLRSAFRLLAGVEPSRLAAVLALFGLGQILTCVRWRLALLQMIPSPPGIAMLLRLYLIGMFVNLGLPTMAGGDVVRAELMRPYVRHRGDAYASILADRLIGLAAVVLLAVAAASLANGLLDPEMRRFVAAAALAGAVVLMALAPALLRLGSGARLGRFAGFLDAFLLLARKPRILALSLAIALAVQVLAVVAPLALLAQALAIDVPLAAHFVFIPVIALATQLPFSPAGLGVREAAVVLLYGQMGVPSEAAFSLGVAWSLILIVFGLCGAVLIPGRTLRPGSGTEP